MALDSFLVAVYVLVDDWWYGQGAAACRGPEAWTQPAALAPALAPERDGVRHKGVPRSPNVGCPGAWCADQVRPRFRSTALSSARRDTWRAPALGDTERLQRRAVWVGGPMLGEVIVEFDG
jgi:hypothetical protein